MAVDACKSAYYYLGMSEKKAVTFRLPREDYKRYAKMALDLGISFPDACRLGLSYLHRAFEKEQRNETQDRSTG